MKRITHIITGLFCLTIVLQAESLPDHDRLLSQLDKTIRKREHLHAEKENQIYALKNELQQASSAEERFDIHSRLFGAYLVYQTDSALKHAQEKQQLLSVLTHKDHRHDVNLNHVNVFIIIGMYKEALEILEQMASEELSGALKERYLHCCRTLYGHMADYAVTETERTIYLEHTDRYRDSLLTWLPSDGTDYMIMKADQLNTHGKYNEAIQLIKDMTDHCQEAEKMRFFAYTLSESYRLKGDRENRKHYLMLSAIADLQYYVKEYAALRELTFLLYEEGDIDRAYEYMKCTLEDAAFCNARSRAIKVAEIFPLIDNAYQLNSARKQRLIAILIVVLAVLAVCLIITVIYIYSQIKKLAAARRDIAQTNKQLTALNQTLTETNIIKEEYIAQYINRCSVYIDKMDEYRKKLSKLAAASKIEELYKAIKSEKLIDDERKDFYREFDRTFLGIFPDFVTSFNELLHEKDRIYPKTGELLNTELRIFALIRLGVTDSTRIAEFLKYSVTTIYNYRSKIRIKAIGDKNEFEAKVMQIK